MANRSLEIDKIAQYYRNGLEDGPEPIVKAMPALLGRIQELERALIPFARAGVQPNNNNLPLIQVYHKDCKAAYEILSQAAARAAQPKEEEWLPAEHV